MRKSNKQLFFSMTYEYLEIYMRTQMLRSPATIESVSYTHLRDHETSAQHVCPLQV